MRAAPRTRPRSSTPHRLLQAALVARTRAFLASPSAARTPPNSFIVTLARPSAGAGDLPPARTRDHRRAAASGADAGEFPIEGCVRHCGGVLPRPSSRSCRLPLLGRAPRRARREVTALHQLLVHASAASIPGPAVDGELNGFKFGSTVIALPLRAFSRGERKNRDEPPRVSVADPAAALAQRRPLPGMTVITVPVGRAVRSP